MGLGSFLSQQCFVVVFGVFLLCFFFIFIFKSSYSLSFIIQQATELAEYTAKIALLEEAKRRKESEVEEWQIRVSICFKATLQFYT